jgi:hypothetical protein
VIGNCQTAMAPLMTNSSDNTAAKMGRRKK